MIQRGFTVVELLITITIMGILLILTIVNVSANQVSNRDNERAADVSTIQTWLENFYSTGSPITGLPGSYPVAAITQAGGVQQYLPDADTNNFIAPGAADVTSSFLIASNNVQTTRGVLPAPDITQYIYQPIDSAGAVCTNASDCRKYNLYYKLEKDNSIVMVSSKNQ